MIRRRSSQRHVVGDPSTSSPSTLLQYQTSCRAVRNRGVCIDWSAIFPGRCRKCRDILEPHHPQDLFKLFCDMEKRCECCSSRSVTPMQGPTGISLARRKTLWSLPLTGTVTTDCTDPKKALEILIGKKGAD